MSRIATSTALFMLFLIGFAAPLRAGGGRAGLIPQSDANRFGLERSWFTRVAVDPARGHIAHITQHVSSTQAYTVHTVSYEGGEIHFSERDVDRFGDPIGKAAAQRLAEREVERLKRAELEPKLNSQTVPVITIYAATDRGLVQAIDGETGRTRWASEVGKPSYPVEAPGVNDQFVGVINGSGVYVLNATDGKLVWHRQVGGAPGAGPTLSDRLLFVPTLNGTVKSFDLENSRQPPTVVRSQGRTLVQAIYNGSVVAWPTDRGNLYVAEGSVTNVLYRVETRHPIVAQAAYLPPNRLLAASTNGYLYCIQETGGAVLWRHSTGERISQSPIVVGDAIYVVTDEANLFRVSGRSGHEQWSTSGVTGFLAASQQRLYCVGTGARLLVIDAATGAPLGGLPLDVLNLQITNKLTDRILVGTRSGFIQCLHELHNDWPVIHLGAAEVARETTPRQPATTTTTPADEEPPPAVLDPFGNPIGGGSADPFGGGDPGSTNPDPFGTGSGGSNPFGSGDADPFGTGSSGSSTPAESDPFSSNPFNR